MSNHFHFLIRVGEQPLSKPLASVLGGFALSYNRRHNRCGYVFQNRYTSILCDQDAYLLELVRYIHLNPLRAGMLDDLASLRHYRWTGHAGIMGKHRQPWHNIDLVLSQFGGTRITGRNRYHSFVEAGLVQSHRNLSGGGLIRSYGGWEAVVVQRQFHTRCIGDERILGDAAFVERIRKEQALPLYTQTERIRQGRDTEALLRYVCTICNIEFADNSPSLRNWTTL
jgi:putative transposase